MSALNRPSSTMATLLTSSKRDTGMVGAAIVIVPGVLL
jgi:hypothetical protein